MKLGDKFTVRPNLSLSDNEDGPINITEKMLEMKGQTLTVVATADGTSTMPANVVDDKESHIWLTEWVVPL